MTAQNFFSGLGLSGNPFQETNADREERLPEYFVPPPYFDSVVGDPDSPSSCVVFAPRGGGKTAQRRVVEMTVDPDRVLVVTYVDFPFIPTRNPADVTVEDHLRVIIRHVLVALVSELGQAGEAATLMPEERRTVQALAESYLSGMTAVELRTSVDALKGLRDRLSDVGRQVGGAWNALAPMLAPLYGIPPSQVPVPTSVAPPAQDPLADFQILARLLTALEYDCVYVLVDCVDETSSTGNDWSAAYALIAPLLSDLRVIETRPFAFKFFLPEQLKAFHQRTGRPDRVHQFELHWSAGEIDRMVNARLRAYSDGTVQSFDELLDPDGPLPAFLRIYLARFSENSPRDMVRMLYRMLVEEERLRVGLGHRISTTAAIAGIQAACEERAQELIPEQMLNELRRLRRVDFTITELANDIFRITSPAMSNKIRTWETKGVVERVQDTRSTGSRPPNRYAISDVRVARVVMQNLDFFQFLNQKLAVCPTCDETLIRDWDEHTEHLCRCGANVQYVPR